VEVRPASRIGCVRRWGSRRVAHGLSALTLAAAGHRTQHSRGRSGVAVQRHGGRPRARWGQAARAPAPDVRGAGSQGGAWFVPR
jgi:hypothetical protein